MLHDETIEKIILRHSGRGMNILEPYLPPDFCHLAAREILSWKRETVILTTGFYVAGHAETDGPLGTMVVAKALKKLGFDILIVTDRFCKNLFEDDNLSVMYIGLNAGKDECQEILSQIDPVGLISIERCGKNSKRKYENMRGVDIGATTAPCDRLFELAYGKYPTIGVGDGGNEIGMGNLAGLISRSLCLNPCVVPADILVIASVSNWGAYGIVAALEELSGMKLMEEFDTIRKYLEKIVDMGCVDGVTHEQIMSVDGMDVSVEEEIYNSLADRVGIENIRRWAV